MGPRSCRKWDTNIAGKHGHKSARVQGRRKHNVANPPKDFSRIPRFASDAKRAKSHANSGISCRTTASYSAACPTTTRLQLGASTWRHVAFIERPVALSNQDAGAFSWLFSSDVCKHCARAGCLESCPTGAIIRTEFDTVYVQPDICNGCGYCVVNCPFGVIDRREEDGRAWKCTLCYDRFVRG